MKNNNQLKKYTRDLIDNSFPELKNKRILISYGQLGPFWGISWWVLPFLKIIVISPKAKNISPEALAGLLAHELSHQVIYQRESWLKYIVRTPLIYTVFKKMVKNEERQVDRMVMDRGFGYQLYILTKIIDQDSSHDCVKNYYFSPEEIEAYCLNNNKRFK